MSHAIRIAWIAMRELLYERVFYLLGSFVLLSLGLGVLLSQLTYGEQAKLSLDFMLGGIHLSMVLFAIFMGISLFQREMTQGSISMVLSKPITRTSFLTGKFLGQASVQGLVILSMGVATTIICWRFDEVINYWAIWQTMILTFFEVTMISAVTYFFAVNAGAITAAVASICIFCLGHMGTVIDRSLNRPGQRAIWKLLRNVIPDLETFNMKSLASYGVSISGAELGWAAAYACVTVTLFLALAAVCFHRKDIAT